MTQPIQPAQPYYPQINKNVQPEVTVHLQRLYAAINDHDLAIVTLNGKIPAATTTTTTTATSNTSQTVIQTGTVIGTVNDQTGLTAYTTQQSDYGAFVLLSDASPIAVTLASAGSSPGIVLPWYTIFINLGASSATLTPSSGTINSNAAFTLFGECTVTVAYDGANFWCGPLLTLPINVPLAPSAPGNFTVAHGLGGTPVAVVISMTSSGAIWLQSPVGYDATNLYLTASDTGLTANAVCLTFTAGGGGGAPSLDFTEIFLLMGA